MESDKQTNKYWYIDYRIKYNRAWSHNLTTDTCLNIDCKSNSPLDDNLVDKLLEHLKICKTIQRIYFLGNHLNDDILKTIVDKIKTVRPIDNVTPIKQFCDWLNAHIFLV